MKIAAVMTKVPKSQAPSWLGVMLGVGVACGCSGSSEPEPATAAAVSTESSVTEPNPEAEAVDSEPAAKPDKCADGTCTPCGDAVCLNGFYCDEGAQACGWVPACAKEPSCECLQQALTGCGCEAREGGLFVRCG